MSLWMAPVLLALLLILAREFKLRAEQKAAIRRVSGWEPRPYDPTDDHSNGDWQWPNR